MVPVINSDQMRQGEKIIAGYFQTTKRNVKYLLKFLDINGHRLIFIRQINAFGIITVSIHFKTVFRVAWTFCESYIFADGDSLWNISLRVDLTLKEEERKEIDFTKRRYTAGRRLVFRVSPKTKNTLWILAIIHFYIFSFCWR